MEMFIRSAFCSFAKVACAGAILLLVAGAHAQNLFVAIANVDEITPGGTQSLFYSGFVGPQGLAFDRAGNLFVADDPGGYIFKVTPARVLSTFASGLSTPEGLAFDSAGNLFEADAGSGNIYEFTTNGVRSTFASGLDEPEGLAFDSAGNLFEADAGSSNICEFTTNGVKSIFVSANFSPEGLAFNNAGDLFFTAGQNIYEYTPGGTQIPFSAGTFFYPWGLAFNSTGDLFVGSLPYGTGFGISKITPAGVESRFAFEQVNPEGLAFPPIPELQGVSVGSGFQLTVSLPTAYFYSTIVQASTNLINWSSLYTNTPPFTYTDSIMTQFPQRFYRALLGP